ncbi:Mitochondrial genome maintenance protein mgm101 [Sphaceloma murrayae]|uniref:Mitochondrial genome maintenance protein MGM101 n=1 Tax=Sphaceloma murrayae TaxID=2082308 RepID=A0A2K1QFZ7_9PEZI|nr:Mitochondrial genome maintenance protein mgm101 [Sphaceloma murrayae]
MRSSIATETYQGLCRAHRSFLFTKSRLQTPSIQTSRRLTTSSLRYAEATTTSSKPATPNPSVSSTSAPQRTQSVTSNEVESPLRSLTDGLDDPPPFLSEGEKQVDWTRSYHGLSSAPFSTEQNAILQQEIDIEDIEIKPDGIVYLPEIKYRRILNKAFGPGGWGLAPRGETIVTGKLVTREYALVANGRLVSIARGEQQYFDPDGIPTATEGCKSNALMRCCKDLGIASELWDPRFIRKFLAEKAKETIVEHATTKKRRKHWMRHDDVVKFPWKEIAVPGQAARR